MNYFKLEKDFTLYRQQYQDFMHELYGSYAIDRIAMDLDAVAFRMKYMKKHQLDLDKMPGLVEQFNKIALQFRDHMADLMMQLIVRDFGGQEYIEELLVSDTKLDQNYLKFKLIIVSSNEEYLNVINNINESIPYNIYPNKYFRFYTDSYNDGIAKAYPELFENREQNVIGRGADHDIFVHSLTFQTSERCSLNCSYCLVKGSKVLMADGSYKNIEDAQVGDSVLAVNEQPNRFGQHIPRASKVTHIFHRQADGYFEIQHSLFAQPIRITGEHPVKTYNHGWQEVRNVKKDDKLLFALLNPSSNINCPATYLSGYKLRYKNAPYTDVYNLETEDHTYCVEGLFVHNCYQFAKSEQRMSFDTAKQFIDNLLLDQYGYINRYNSPAIIIEFIGGEPLLEITLTRQIYEYFLEQCYKLNHPWFTMHRVSICSNGLQYFNKEVQSFFKEYASQVSFNISIDGNKELHNSCRIQPNGEGSYDIDMMALKHFNENYTAERNSKMTLAPSNISYLYDSVVDFIKNGMSIINLNCVFEEGWEPEHAKIEYEQLKKLAMYLLDNDLEHLYIAIFSDRQEGMSPREQDGTFCGGNGSMLAIRPNGEFYPCLRYMPSSVGPNRESMMIGTVQDGMDSRDKGSKVLKRLDRMTRRSQNNDICFECPLSNSCSSCLALGHTVFNNPNKRTNFTCIMVIAEALANVFYWNAMITKHPDWNIPVRHNVVPDHWALLVIDQEELNFLKQLEQYAELISQ